MTWRCLWYHHGVTWVWSCCIVHCVWHCLSLPPTHLSYGWYWVSPSSITGIYRDVCLSFSTLNPSPLTLLLFSFTVHSTLDLPHPTLLTLQHQSTFNLLPYASIPTVIHITVLTQGFKVETNWNSLNWKQNSLEKMHPASCAVHAGSYFTWSFINCSSYCTVHSEMLY